MIQLQYVKIDFFQQISGMFENFIRNKTLMQPKVLEDLFANYTAPFQRVFCRNGVTSVSIHPATMGREKSPPVAIAPAINQPAGVFGG